MAQLKIFDEPFHNLIKGGIKNILLDNNDTADDLTENESSGRDWQKTEKQSAIACSYCRVQFEDVSQQREHYKLDWHRYNLRQSLLSREPISEEKFNEINEKDDVSSISGSDSEREDDNLDAAVRAQGKNFLQSADNRIFSLYSCLLYSKKEELSEDALFARLKECAITNKKWTVMMLGGGHFAGAVFDGTQAVVHKTFHCYTIRAGQGGSQSARDNKKGGSQPKSAGASLRRYNEQSLVQHVKSIVEAWKSEISQSSLIVYRASGPTNRSVLFGGAEPLFDRKDTRLRAIPFSTRRATFKEVQRVHSVLTTANVYESVETALQSVSRHKHLDQNIKRLKSKSSCINRAKSRETRDRSLNMEISSSSSSSDDEQNKTIELVSESVEISMDDCLVPFGDSLTQEERKRGQHKKKKQPRKSKTKKLREKEEFRKKELVEVLRRGDLSKLDKLLRNQLKVLDESSEFQTNEENQTENSTGKNQDVVNEVLDEDGNTLLHLAAIHEQNEVMQFLLENEANPCLKNKKQQTAYTCTQSKDMRETLKQFARDNPDKYNYNKAQIPTNSLNVEEQTEKKKVQRKIKKEKEKIKKQEEQIKRQEEVEKQRFLSLPDSEKRALAADRRSLNQSGRVIARCFSCATDISGKTPFVYADNRFCSVECLKAHRMKNPVVLS